MPKATNAAPVLGLLLISVFVAANGQPVADVEIADVTIVEPANGFTPAGTVGALEVVFRNNGPDSAGTVDNFDVAVVIFLSNRAISVPTIPGVGLVPEVYFLPDVGQTDERCAVGSEIIDAVPFVIEPWLGLASPIQAGEVITCRYLFEVSPYIDAPVVLNWRRFVQDEVDPNPNNDLSDTVIFGATPPVSVPIDRWASWILLLLLSVTAARSLSTRL